MKKKLLIGLLALLWLSVLPLVGLGAEENTVPEEQQTTASTPMVEEVNPPIQLQNIRYSLAKEKNRLVFDFNLPFSYQITSPPGSKELTILVNGIDGRVKKDILSFTDLALKEISVLPDPASGNIFIKIMFNYRLPYQTMVITNPDRLVIDMQKIFEEKKENRIAPGLDYTQIYSGTLQGPLQVDMLKVDLSNLNLEVKPVVARKETGFSKEVVSQLAAKANAVAAINGTYFASNGTPLGLLMVDGNLLSYPWEQRTALGITKNNKILIDNVGLYSRVTIANGQKLIPDGVDCARGENQLILYTSKRGATTKTNECGLEVSVVNGKVTAIGNGNLPIPAGGYVVSAHGNKKSLLQGLALDANLQVEMGLTTNWLNQGVVHILSGGPRLVKGGTVFITAEQEKFRSDITQGRAPRSALGVTKDQKLLLVAVSGRQPAKSVGLTLKELAQLMIKQGAVEAMNLDGGGSTTLLVQGQVVNLPSDGQERKVSNALVINYLGPEQMVKAKNTSNKNNISKENTSLGGDELPNWL